MKSTKIFFLCLCKIAKFFILISSDVFVVNRSGTNLPERKINKIMLLIYIFFSVHTYKEKNQFIEILTARLVKVNTVLSLNIFCVVQT